LASVAVTVKLYGPAIAGVPVIDPDEVNTIPGGSEPAVNANVYGPVPPVAVAVCA
jgi:hypothetical protein